MWERDFLLWLHLHSSGNLDALFLFMRLLGSNASLGLLLTACVIWHASRREWTHVLVWLIFAGTAWCLVNGIKTLVRRPRPDLWVTLIHENGFSFPSGHALGTSAFFPFAAFSVFRAKFSVRSPLIVLSCILAGAIGFSRVYLGVHWPTDVIAGWTIGFSEAAVGTYMLNCLTQRKEVNPGTAT